MMTENIFTEALRKRRSLDLRCYNTLIVADPGEAGNFVMKTDIIDVLRNTNNDVVVIDAFGDYGPELKAYGAKRISLLMGEHALVAPLYQSTFIPNDSEDEVFRAIDTLLAMMKSMELLPSTLHTSSATAAIRNAVNRALERERRTMADILAELAKEEDSQTKLFVHQISRLGCVSENTNIDFDQRCIILHMDSIDDRLKAAIVISVLSHLLPAIHEKFRNTDKFTWVYIPHLDALLKKDSDEFIISFVKRLRRHAGICVGSVEKGSFGSRTSQAMYNLCSCIYVLNPSRKAHEWLDVLDIAPESVDCMDNMAYTLGEEIGFIPPRDIREDIPEITPEEGTALLSSGQNLNFLERAVYNILFKRRKRAD